MTENVGRTRTTWSAMTALIIASFLSCIVHYGFPPPTLDPLLDVLKQPFTSNESEPATIPFHSSKCDAGSVEDEPFLLVADLDVAATSQPEGFFEVGENEEGIFVDYDPGESALLRLGVATNDGQVVRVRLRTMRNPNDEAIAVHYASGVITWWSKERSGRVDNVTQPICTSMRVGLANGVAAELGSVSVSLLFGDQATEAYSAVNEYFQQLHQESLRDRVSTVSQLMIIASLLVLVVQRVRRERNGTR